MKIGFIIICRYNSKRLPGKILREINRKPILQHIIDRLLLIPKNIEIVVATSEEKTDNPIEDYCNRNGIHIFRGSLDNVAKRFLNCALHFNFDFATRINGDNIFIDSQLVSEMIEIAQTDHFDFISNVKQRTFPKGMSVEIVRVAHYQKLYTRFESPGDFEHVTYFLYQNDKNERYFYFYNKICPEAAGIQLAIDTKDDYELAKNIFSKYLQEKKTYNLQEIYQFYKTEHHE